MSFYIAQGFVAINWRSLINFQVKVEGNKSVFGCQGFDFVHHSISRLLVLQAEI